MNAVVRDPFFWALVSMFGLVASCVVVAGGPLGRRRYFGALVSLVYTAGRVILPLPWCPQPRLEGSPWPQAIGVVLVLVGLAFCARSLSIEPLTAPSAAEVLRTRGLHGIVRHPVYTGGLLWTLGWSLMFRSTIGVALVPVWWMAVSCLVLVEEASLERTLGARYREYRHRVISRLIPGLPL